MNNQETEQVIKHLIELLGAEDEEEYHTASRQLREIGNPVVPALIEALKNDNFDVRSGAAEVLGEIADPRAVTPLIEALEVNEADTKAFILIALGNFGDKRAIQPVIAALNDEHWEVREASCLTLRIIGNEQALSALQLLIETEPDANVKEAANEAIDQIKQRQKL